MNQCSRRAFNGVPLKVEWFVHDRYPSPYYHLGEAGLSAWFLSEVKNFYKRPIQRVSKQIYEDAKGKFPEASKIIVKVRSTWADPVQETSHCASNSKDCFCMKYDTPCMNGRCAIH